MCNIYRFSCEYIVRILLPITINHFTYIFCFNKANACEYINWAFEKGNFGR